MDDPTHALSATQVDATLANVAECVSKIKATGFTDEEFTKGECWNSLIEDDIKSCLIIKVAPDWHLNCTGTDQVFPCNIGNERCLEKGQTPTPQCPCSCRAQIQDGNLIVTPNERLLPAYFTTLLTGCLSPWVGRLADCSSAGMIAPIP